MSGVFNSQRSSSKHKLKWYNSYLIWSHHGSSHVAQYTCQVRPYVADQTVEMLRFRSVFVGSKRNVLNGHGQAIVSPCPLLSPSAGRTETEWWEASVSSCACVCCLSRAGVAQESLQTRQLICWLKDWQIKSRTSPGPKERKKESGLKRRLGIYSSVSVFAFWIQKLWCCRWHCLLSRSKPFIITSPGKLWGWQHLISSHPGVVQIITMMSNTTTVDRREKSTGRRNEKSHGRGCFFSNMHVFVTGLVIIHKVQRNSTTQS